MCCYISIEKKKPYYLIWSVICKLRKNIGTDKEYVNDYSKHAPQLDDMELGFINISNKPICEDQNMIQFLHRMQIHGDIGSLDNNVETYLNMYISVNNKPKDPREIEIHEMMDVPEDTIISEDLYNQSTNQLQDIKDSGELEDEKHDMDNTLPP